MIDKSWVFYVNPEQRIIQHMALGHLTWFEEMKSIGDFRLLERLNVMSHPHTEWWGDEEGLLKNDQSFFRFSYNINLLNDVQSPYNPSVAHAFDHIETRSFSFCGPSFFIGNTEREDRPQSVQMSIGEFASCIEFMSEGYTEEPKYEVHIVGETNE